MLVKWYRVFAVALVAAFSINFAQAADKLSSGEFTGINNHVTKGMVSIVKTDNGHEIVMADNFFFDGAPDPKVALGKDGQYDPNTLIELLRSNTGAQRYAIPAGIDVSNYNEVHIWCEKFNVGLAIAPLN